MAQLTGLLPPLRLASPTATRELVLFVAILIVGAGFSLASPYFLTVVNLVQTLRAGLELALVSAGMTLVIIMGGIDVSVGGIMAVSAILIGKSYQAGLSSWLVVPIGLASGTLLGAWNGFLTTKLRVPPIIATLGSMYIFSAIMFLVIGGAWISGLPGTLSPLVNGKVVGIPASLLVILAVYGLCWVLLRQLPYGRHLYAIGCSEQSAKLVGINVDRTKIAAYAILGLLAGFAALLYVARLRNVEINIGTTVALGSHRRDHPGRHQHPGRGRQPAGDAARRGLHPDRPERSGPGRRLLPVGDGHHRRPADRRADGRRAGQPQ